MARPHPPSGVHLAPPMDRCTDGRAGQLSGSRPIDAIAARTPFTGGEAAEHRNRRQSRGRNAEDPRESPSEPSVAGALGQARQGGGPPAGKQAEPLKGSMDAAAGLQSWQQTYLPSQVPFVHPSTEQ